MSRHASLLIVCAAMALVGCATPTASFVDRARSLGFAVDAVAGDPYTHVVVAAPAGGGGALHVYVDHDGLPWQRVDEVSPDPTPRRPLALELMARDQGDRIYLGRPCYFGRMHDTGCGPARWTSRRYADEIVRSMAAAVNRIAAARPGGGPVVLIGYSGGGTLAWLMAREVPSAAAVVTVAANLDVAAWTAWHRYTPLAGSRDPAAEPPLPGHIRQVHLVGLRDDNVPPWLARAVVARQPAASFVDVPGFDHVCCWVDRWPGLMQAALAAAPAAGEADEVRSVRFDPASRRMSHVAP